MNLASITLGVAMTCALGGASRLHLQKNPPVAGAVKATTGWIKSGSAPTRYRVLGVPSKVEFDQESDMRANVRVVAAAAAFSSATFAAQAQQAVQWRVEDGGNGHWYQGVLPNPRVTWLEANQRCTDQGGHLATLTSAAENIFVYQQIASDVQYWYLHPCSCISIGPWIGFRRTNGAWRWVTGEPTSFTAWHPGEPFFGSPHDFVRLFNYTGPLTPAPLWDNFTNDDEPTSYIIEWSADCNGDGIVDYGQCRDGSLPDYNGNNIPDCCETGTPCQVSSYPVQWRVEDGGNGHWYQVVLTPNDITFTAAAAQAAQRGGYLFSGCGQEFDSAIAITQALSPTAWVAGPFSQWTGPWIGLQLVDDMWTWSDGTTCGFDRWDTSASQPDSPAISGESVAFLYTVGAGPAGVVHDVPATRTTRSFLMEWSADCNNDGIVDIGQILAGQFQDSNHDGVPDTCQCLGDVSRNGTVDGVDLAAILGAWGTNGNGEFQTDIDGDGLVGGTDLAYVLGGWGPCQ